MSLASIFRYLCVLALMLAIAVVYLLLGFRGITTPEGMEKAQLAREIARGSYKTKMIRPVSIGQFETAKKRLPFLHEVSRADTYNAPLYPLALGIVFKAFKADDFEKWKMEEGQEIYALDRVVVGLNMVFFILASFIAYFLARKIFDPMIAGITFFLLITTDLFWRFTETGMANSLMLMLFMAALFCIYVATEKSLQEGENGFLFGTLGGIFLILLCLTHWMALWILIGYIIYAFFFIRPIGGIASVTVILACLGFAHPVLQNYQQTGHPFGTAFFTLYSGLGLSEEVMMRSGGAGDFYVPIKAVILNFVGNLTTGFGRMFEYSGLVYAAPVFFLSCLHEFKSKHISNFRWGILIIWGVACIGMAIYGIGEDAFYSNQLHYLFTPIMAAYGMAMIAIIWNRTKFGSGEKSWRYGYIWIVAAISAVPMLFSLPQIALSALTSQRSLSSWPPYYASGTNRILSRAIPEKQYIFSDQPWAVAWYADRHAIWTPMKHDTMRRIEAIADNQRLPIAGVNVTPVSVGAKTLFESSNFSGDMFSLNLSNWMTFASRGKIGLTVLSKKMPVSEDITRRYSNIVPYNGVLMLYYSAESVDLSEPEELD